VPDIQSRTFIVTGANSGLGLETARRLASVSPRDTVVLARRDLSKAAIAQRDIRSTSGNVNVAAMELDLSSLASVRGFVARYRETVARPIDALIYDAGISGRSRQTVDGLDPVFETNHLGHFVLVTTLLGEMTPTGRVLSVTSDMHEPPGRKLVWPGAEALASPGRRVECRASPGWPRALTRSTSPGSTSIAVHSCLRDRPIFPTLCRTRSSCGTSVSG
jgi:NAD(P)-dependent dehydrogenase (short-subunit alcohol dehydrogenase family)